MKKTMMNAAIFGAVLMGVVSMIGCKTTDAESGATKAAKLAGTWTMYEMSQGGQASEVPEMTGASLTFAGNSGNVQVAGFAGVNNLSGVAKVKGSSISFGTLATTMMAGSPEDEAIEISVLAILNDAQSFSVSGDVLKIVAKNGDALCLKKFTLASSAWGLSSYNSGNAVVTIPSSVGMPALEFDAKDGLSGSTGVNNLMGTYSLDNENCKLSFSAIGTTRMAAIDEEAAKFEQTFLALLEEVAVYDISGNILTLRNAQDVSLLVFERN